MNDATNNDLKSSTTLGDKATVVSTVGYFCIAITWWMTGMLMANWFTSATVPGFETATLYSVGSILLVIIGILSLVFGKRVLDSIIFLAMAGFFFALYSAHITSIGGGHPDAYTGWFALVWAIFFCYLWISSLMHRTGTIKMLFLLLFWLSSLAVAISGWTGSDGIYIVGGYLSLITAILAFIVSALEVLCGGHSSVSVQKQQG